MLPRGVMNKMNKLVSSGTRHNIGRQYFFIHINESANKIL